MRASLLGQHPLHIDSKKPWREALHRQRDQFGAPRIENTSQENWSSLTTERAADFTNGIDANRKSRGEARGVTLWFVGLTSQPARVRALVEFQHGHNDYRPERNTCAR
jgi:hypothetical protein